MAEHDLQSVAFPKLNEAQMAALDRCPLTKLPALPGRGDALQGRRPGLQVLRRQVRQGRDRGRIRGDSEDHRGPGARGVHRRRGATDGRPGDRQCHRPGRLRSLRGVARRPAQADQRPSRAGRHHPAGVHRPPATPERVRRVRRAARDRLALLAGTRSVSANSWPRTGCRSPGSISRPIRK